MSERRLVPLSEVADVSGGYAFKSEDYVPNGHFVLRTLNISDQGRVDRSNAVFLPEQDVPKYPKFSLREFDTVFVMVGATLGKTGIITSADLPALLNQNMWRIRAKTDKCDPRFLYYCFLVNKIKIEGFASGSARSFLRRDDCREMLVEVPSLSDQKAIAHILGTLDDKIELNQKMNQTLEEIAKAIFKSWFVDFDPVRAKAEGRPTGLPPEISDLFPDELVDSEVGEIPKGWGIAPLSDAINLDSGFAYNGKSKGHGDKFLVTMGCVSQSNRFNLKGLHPYEGEFKDRNIVKAGDICISSHDVTQAREHLGAPFIVPESIGNTLTAAATNTFIVRPTGRLSTEFLYQLFQTQRYRNEMIASAKGTAILHISKTAVTKFLYCDPSKLVKNRFDAIVIPMVQMINILTNENQVLGELRDTLLPKLISGELRIPDAEKFLEEAGL